MARRLRRNTACRLRPENSLVMSLARQFFHSALHTIARPIFAPLADWSLAVPRGGEFLSHMMRESKNVCQPFRNWKRFFILRSGHCGIFPLRSLPGAAICLCSHQNAKKNPKTKGN
jgi:hypothetical protein